jgi:hypothetical protein
MSLASRDPWTPSTSRSRSRSSPSSSSSSSSTSASPRVVHRDLVLVFGTVVVLFALAIARLVWPDLPTAVSQIGTLVLLLQPYLTLRLTAHFVPVSRRVSMAALAPCASPRRPCSSASAGTPR